MARPILFAALSAAIALSTQSAIAQSQSQTSQSTQPGSAQSGSAQSQSAQPQSAQSQSAQSQSDGAQSAQSQTAQFQSDASQSDGQPDESLKVFFATGSAQIAGDQQSMLDTAARVFRQGDPFVMIVAGGADTTGSPGTNLSLSVRRAQAVADGLADRGIPADRLQVVGRGTSELEVDTGQNVAERDNRIVEITWR